MLELAAIAVVALGAFVQGVSGLGFALVAAPLMSQIFPGSEGIGLVISLGTLQAFFIAARSRGEVRLEVMKSVLPALAVGVIIGVLVQGSISPELRTALVIASATVTIWWLFMESRIRVGRAEPLLPAWGAFINTLTGVGGPPVSSYLISRIHDHESFIRTQQIIFISLNLCAIPSLGVATPSITFGTLALAALAVGSAIGSKLRLSFSVKTGRSIALIAIVTTACTSVILAIR